MTHGNGVVDTQANDPDQMRRPFSISTTAVVVVLEPYRYDPFNQMINLDGGGNDETHLYTTGDERLVSTHSNSAQGYPAGRTDTYLSMISTP